MLQLECLETKKSKSTRIFSVFCIEPLLKGEGITFGNAIRRVLLSDIVGTAFIGVQITGVNHEFSLTSCFKEDIIEILLNIKQIILSGKSKAQGPLTAELKFQGPGILTAGDIKLPEGIQAVEPTQYLATVTNSQSISMRFFIETASGYVISKHDVFLKKAGFLNVDAVFMPVRKVNYYVESLSFSKVAATEKLIIEIETNGSKTPLEVLVEATTRLANTFKLLSVRAESHNVPLSKPDSLEQVAIDFDKTSIADLDLPLRAYKCLKLSSIDTIGDLIKYSYRDLLKLRNLGEKSVTEVSTSLKNRFNKNLKF